MSETNLYYIKAVSLTNEPDYSENLPFIKEPTKEDITSFLALIRPHSRYSKEVISWKHVATLDEQGKPIKPFDQP